MPKFNFDFMATMLGDHVLLLFGALCGGSSCYVLDLVLWWCISLLVDLTACNP